MTADLSATQLLAYIGAVLLAQLLTAVGIALWRRPASAAAAAATQVPIEPVATAGAWAGWRDFRVVRREFEDAAQSQCSFYLQPVDGKKLPPFRPGQYLSLHLTPGATGPAGAAQQRPITRCYSLSDRPEATGYRITVKRVPAPADRPELPAGLSSNYLHDVVHEGDVLQVKAPAGHFFIDTDASVPVVLAAGGIGITPMVSMLRWCLAEQPGRTVHLYYGVRSSADHAFKPLLQELAAANPCVHLHVAYSQPGPGDTQGLDYRHLGRVDVALLRGSLPHGRHQFYVCGPAPMMQSLVPALREWGVPAEDIHYEAFGPATVRPVARPSNEPVAGVSGSFEVRFSQSGRTLQWDRRDANLLDMAERHDLMLDSGCRSGSCGACQTRLLSGSVSYAEKPDHDIAPGHCLLCVGRPASALVLQA